MNRTVFTLEKAIKNLAEEDKNDQFERLIEEDVAFYEKHGHIPCIIATTNSLLERISQIRTNHISIPSLSSLEEVHAEHLRLVERSRILIVVTMARQLVPVNLSILLQHADLYSVPVLVLIDGISNLSNPGVFNAREQLIKEMPCTNFKYLDLQSMSDEPSIKDSINNFVELQSIQHRESALFEQRAKDLTEYSQSRLKYLSRYLKSLSDFKKDVDEYERRSALLVSGAIVNYKAEIHDAIQSIGATDPSVFINQVTEYESLEKRLVCILEVIKTSIKKTILDQIPAIVTKMTSAINKELEGTRRDLSKLAVELSRSLGVNVNLNPEKGSVALSSEPLISGLNQVIDEMVTAPKFMMLMAKYAESVGSKLADFVESKINRIKTRDINNESIGESLASDSEDNQIEVDGSVGKIIRNITKAFPEQFIVSQLPKLILDILTGITDELTHRADSFIATTVDDVQDSIPELYYDLKHAVTEKRRNIEIRTDKINKVVDELR